MHNRQNYPLEEVRVLLILDRELDAVFGSSRFTEVYPVGFPVSKVPIVAHFCLINPYQQQPEMAIKHPNILMGVTGFLKMRMLTPITITVLMLPATVTVTEEVALRTMNRVTFKM